MYSGGCSEVPSTAVNKTNLFCFKLLHLWMATKCRQLVLRLANPHTKIWDLAEIIFGKKYQSQIFDVLSLALGFKLPLPTSP